MRDKCGGYNLLDCLSRAMQINHSLVDPHLKAVPRLGALPAGCLAGGDAECLGGHADGALHTEVLFLGTANQVLTHWVRDRTSHDICKHKLMLGHRTHELPTCMYKHTRTHTHHTHTTHITHTHTTHITHTHTTYITHTHHTERTHLSPSS